MRSSLLTLLAATAVTSTTASMFPQRHEGIAASLMFSLSVLQVASVSAVALPQDIRLEARHRNHGQDDDTNGNGDSNTDDDDSNTRGDRQRNRGNRGNRGGNNNNGTANANLGAGNDDNTAADRNTGNGNSSGGNNVDGVDSGASNCTDGNPSFNGSSGGNNVDGVDTEPGAPVTPGAGSNSTDSSGGNNVDGQQQNANGTATGDVPLTTGSANIGVNGTSSGTGTLPAGFPPAPPAPGFVAGEKRSSNSGLSYSARMRRDFQVSRKIGRSAGSKVPAGPKRDMFREVYDV